MASDHFTTPQFWECYNALPNEIQILADKNFEILKADVKHPSLHFKKLGNDWSVRIGLDYRALAIQTKEGFIWYWIGTHAEYDRII